MPRIDCEIVIIGAGVAGLAAAAKLTAAGKDVLCLEAGERVGGRILTVRDPLSPAPIELGAEFVHGLPPATWNCIRDAGLRAYEQTATALHIHHGAILKEREVGAVADDVLSQLGKVIRKKDESFDDYLTHSKHSDDRKKWARLHVQGFNAARSDLISAASLTDDSEAADKIEGNRAFRILEGYDAIPHALLRSIPNHQAVLKLRSLVERIIWRRGSVQVTVRSALDRDESEVRCRQAIVTVPLGVLQAPAAGRGAILFDPVPRRILQAAASLQFGQAYRITFRFQNTFWEDHDEYKHAGFLVSQGKGFFTWWTTHPVIAPLLTGWTAGPAAEEFRRLDGPGIAAQALASLARILNRKVPRPEACYFHDWRNDPLFRGAYSYVPVNGLAAREQLAKPVEGTLYFAGEATNLNGHSGTVHGAIESGIRAAEAILAPAKKRG